MRGLCMCVCVSVCVCACLCVCVCVEGAVVMGGKNLFLDADAPPCGGPWPSFPAAPKVEYNHNALVKFYNVQCTRIWQ